MNSLPPLLLGVATLLCSLYQLRNSLRTRCKFSFALSVSILTLITIKMVSILIKQDLGSNYQYISLFPLAIISIIKTFKDLELHPYLRASLLSLFFVGVSFQIPKVNQGQTSYKLLREKVKNLTSKPSTLNIFFYPDNPFMQEVANAYIATSGVKNTLTFSVPMLSDQYELVPKFKNSFNYINVISLESAEESIAAGVLEAFLASHYLFEKVHFERLEFSDHLLKKVDSYSLKKTLYRRK